MSKHQKRTIGTPSWIIECEVQRTNAMLDGGTQSLAFSALQKLMQVSPRRRRNSYQDELLSLVKSDEALLRSLIEDFVVSNASSAFRAANGMPSAFEVGRKFRDI